MIIVLLIAILLGWRFLTPPSLPAGEKWYNPDWRYRQPLEINNTGGTLTDYQLSVTVDTATLISQGKMRSDGADIIFTDSDGSTKISHWIYEIQDNDYTFAHSVQDARIHEGTPYRNYHNGSLVIASLVGEVQRSFIKFDLPSSNGTLVYAELLLYRWGGIDPSGRTYRVARVTEPWNETTITWNNQPAINTSHQASFTVPSALGWVQRIFVKDIVQDWLDGAPNYGLRIHDSQEDSTTVHTCYYHQRECSNTSLGPILRCLFQIRDGPGVPAKGSLYRMNTAETKIYVKVPSIPANSTKTIFMYYGNLNYSTSESSFSDTMIFGETFSDADWSDNWSTVRGSWQREIQDEPVYINYPTNWIRKPVIIWLEEQQLFRTYFLYGYGRGGACGIFPATNMSYTYSPDLLRLDFQGHIYTNVSTGWFACYPQTEGSPMLYENGKYYYPYCRRLGDPLQHEIYMGESEDGVNWDIYAEPACTVVDPFGGNASDGDWVGPETLVHRGDYYYLFTMFYSDPEAERVYVLYNESLTGKFNFVPGNNITNPILKWDQDWEEGIVGECNDIRYSPDDNKWYMLYTGGWGARGGQKLGLAWTTNSAFPLGESGALWTKKENLDSIICMGYGKGLQWQWMHHRYGTIGIWVDSNGWWHGQYYGSGIPDTEDDEDDRWGIYEDVGYAICYDITADDPIFIPQNVGFEVHDTDSSWGMMVSSGSYENVTIIVRGRLTDNRGLIGMVFRYQDSNNFYLASVHDIGAYDEDLIKLQKKVGGEWSYLTGFPKSPESSTTASNIQRRALYWFKIEIAGDGIKYSISDDGWNYTQYADLSDSSLTSSGKIGFFTYGKGMFDDVWVYKTADPEPTLLPGSEETFLSIGWNRFYASPEDVGRSLGQMNVSLWSDNITFTVIRIELTNGTSWTFRRGYHQNENKTVTSTSDIIWVYSHSSGIWAHNY